MMMIPDKAVFQNDAAFDALLPSSQSDLSRNQWTPLSVVKEAADFLAAPGRKVLDIGSGNGKFCLYAASLYPETLFFGIEQRRDLHETAQSIKNLLGIQNVTFIRGDILRQDLRVYDAFYFYNAFYENLAYGSSGIQNAEPLIDLGDFEEEEGAEISSDLYFRSSEYLRESLARTVPGTRLVTFHSAGIEVPRSFIEMSHPGHRALKFWIRKS